MQSIVPSESRRGMERLTQFVTTSFSGSRRGVTSPVQLPSLSSRPAVGCTRSSDLIAPFTHHGDTVYSDERRLMMKHNDRERDVDIDGPSIGSRTPDDTDAADEDNFRSQLSAFTSGRPMHGARCICDEKKRYRSKLIREKLYLISAI